MHEVLVNRIGGLSLPRKSVVRLTDRPDMTLDVYRGRKTIMQQQNLIILTVPYDTMLTFFVINACISTSRVNSATRKIDCGQPSSSKSIVCQPE